MEEYLKTRHNNKIKVIRCFYYYKYANGVIVFAPLCYRVCVKSCRIFLNSFVIGQESMIRLLLCWELFNKFLCSLCKFTSNNTEITAKTK